MERASIARHWRIVALTTTLFVSLVDALLKRQLDDASLLDSRQTLPPGGPGCSSTFCIWPDFETD